MVISVSVRGSSIMYGPLPIMTPFSHAVGIGGLDGLGRHREEELEPGDGVEVRVRLGERDGERHRLVVGLDSGERVGRAVQLLGATLDEVHQVAVVTGEVGVRRPLPRVGERAGQDLFTGRERDAVADLEGPDGGVLVGFVGLGDMRDDLGVLGIARVDVGQPVVEGVDDLVGVQRRVERRVEVLGRVADEGAEVDELASGCSLRGLVGAVLFRAPPASSSSSPQAAGDERQTKEHGKELQALALESHVVVLLIAGQDAR